MIIKIGNVASTIEGASKEQLAKLRKKLSCYAPGYKYTYLFKRKKWDGKVSLLDDNRFPTGLIESVCGGLVRAGTTPHVEDYRNIKVISQLHEHTVPLRPYQEDAIIAAFGHTVFNTWWPRGVLEMATGAGKTEVAAAMIQMTQVPTLFVVHRKDLLWQSHKRFQEKYGIECGVVGDGVAEPGKVTVATIQTLWKHKESIAWLEDIEQVFFDEAHMLAATLDKGNIFTQVAAQLPNAYMRWGLTATPFMRDSYSNWLLEGVTGPSLYRIKNRELIEEGYLADAKVTMFRIPAHDSIPNSWPECYETGVMLDNRRNGKIIDCIKTYPRPILILVQRTGHGEILSDMAAKQGLKVPFVCGADNSTIRIKRIASLVDKKCDAVIASTIWDEGVDIPEIKTLILAGGGKSPVKSLQRLGRGLRLSEGKDHVEIIDFLDMSTRWLRSHSRAREKVWKSEGFKVGVKDI